MTIQIIAAVVMTAWALAVAWAIHALEHAPYGYEDEDGFHYGPEPAPRFDPGLHIIHSMDDFNARRET